MAISSAAAYSAVDGLLQELRRTRDPAPELEKVHRTKAERLFA